MRGKTYIYIIFVVIFSRDILNSNVAVTFHFMGEKRHCCILRGKESGDDDDDEDPAVRAACTRSGTREAGLNTQLSLSSPLNERKRPNIEGRSEFIAETVAWLGLSDRLTTGLV